MHLNSNIHLIKFVQPQSSACKPGIEDENVPLKRPKQTVIYEAKAPEVSRDIIPPIEEPDTPL